MSTIDIITILVTIGIGVIGWFIGFGRSLKFFSGGIFGFIISIFVCIAIGGMIQNIFFVKDAINAANAWFASGWNFLQHLYLANVIYYIILFVVVQICRIIIVKIFINLGDIDNKAVDILNRIFGVVFSVVAVLTLILLTFAFLKFFDGTPFMNDFVASMKDSIFYYLYTYNPITFII